MNIYEKLQKSRVELQKKGLKKSGKNAFSGFSYFELSDFLPSINEIFSENKLCSHFNIEENKAVLRIFDAEKPDSVISFMMPTASLTLKGCNEIQALGGINTYCRRYLYLNALEIVENDLFDAETGKKENKKPAATPPKIKEHKEETEAVISDDFDVFEELKTKTDMPNLVKCYNENKSKVKDIKGFDNLFKELRSKLRSN